MVILARAVMHVVQLMVMVILAHAVMHVVQFTRAYLHDAFQQRTIATAKPHVCFRQVDNVLWKTTSTPTHTCVATRCAGTWMTTM
jgi:hypothetical protein